MRTGPRPTGLWDTAHPIIKPAPPTRPSEPPRQEKKHKAYPEFWIFQTRKIIFKLKIKKKQWY